MIYREKDSRALDVLQRALHSGSPATRVRAVSMLERLDCDDRITWLSDALADAHPSVSATALCVMAWVLDPSEAPWPAREGPPADTGLSRSEGLSAGLPDEPASRWQWEYVVEIWREDGLLVGVYPASTCAEDDEHAKRIALGQAIIDSAGRRADRFDPGSAAAFIVEKRQLEQNAAGRRERHRDDRDAPG